MNDAKIIPIDRLELRLVDWNWPFAHERRNDIASHFDAQRAANPALWNGRVFLVRNFDVSNATLRCDFFETGFAELLAWRDWGFEDRSIYSCFAMAAIESSDKGFLLGVMGQHTANPGKIYFPTGTPDRDDLYGERIDLDMSVRRELAEETGLEFERFQSEPGWHAVLSGQHVAMIKHLRSSENADSLQTQVLTFLARDEQPEFSDVRIYYGRKNLSSKVPPYVQAFLEQVWDEKNTSM